jgi:hypothetical protein
VARRSIWLTRRAIVSHVVLALWVPGCAVAAWWQVGIALSGDSLGWVYSVMWPCFAIFGIVFWWFLIHDDPDSLGMRAIRRQQQAASGADPTAPAAAPTVERSAEDAAAIARAEADDPELAAYNAYLAAAAQQPKTWRRR